MASARKTRPLTTPVLVLSVEVERETDGRWIAEIPQIPGVMKYGKTRTEALRNVQALALRVLAESSSVGFSGAALDSSR